MKRAPARKDRAGGAYDALLAWDQNAACPCTQIAFTVGPPTPKALATGAIVPEFPGVPGVMFVHSRLTLSCWPLRKKQRPAAILRRSAVLVVVPESAWYL